MLLDFISNIIFIFSGKKKSVKKSKGKARKIEESTPVDEVPVQEAAEVEEATPAVPSESIKVSVFIDY